MASSSCILQKLTQLRVVILITFSLLSASFSGYGDFSIFITSLVLIISTIFFTYAQRKNQEETVQEEEEEVVSQSSTNEKQQQQQDSSEQQCSPHLEKVSEEEEEEEEKVKTESTSSAIYQEEAVQQQEVGAIAYQIHQDLYSESESIDNRSFSSDQDSDIDWPYSGKLSGQSPECSDDSISDEESLIEIALPSGNYLGPKEEDPNKFSLHQKFQDFSTEKTIFQLFAENNDMNEEENLIEIDLSMGSIKCSRFEIEA